MASRHESGHHRRARARHRAPPHHVNFQFSSCTRTPRATAVASCATYGKPRIPLPCAPRIWSPTSNPSGASESVGSFFPAESLAQPRMATALLASPAEKTFA